MTIATVLALAIATVLAILAAWDLPPFGGRIEKTDNAYVRGRTTVIAPQVSGYVAAVLVKDYEYVQRGQVLVLIDDVTYRARVAQSQATLDTQIAALANSRQARMSRVAGLSAQVAALGSAQAQLLRARADMARATDLVRDGSISVRERDQTLAAFRAAEAQVRQAEATDEIGRQDIRTVDVGRGGLAAQVEAARAALRGAAIDLRRTVIRAPESGQLGEVSVRLGQYVAPGTQLFSLVPPDRWVIANYKEDQTGRMRPGQRATVTVDALDDARFSGRIERISPAAGSEFAVLKPDNATGNFVKIPQRIGIRIAIDPNQRAATRLRPGMSIEARIDTAGGP
ncbi:HlyD family secretion protein [Rhizorhabdus argentea]|uniref:HlyD family secretion protein n=1 Tax=Rhizorhabdus argentea TaxID=1387174 RepID=UPI0030EDA173